MIEVILVLLTVFVSGYGAGNAIPIEWIMSKIRKGSPK